VVSRAKTSSYISATTVSDTSNCLFVITTWKAMLMALLPTVASVCPAGWTSSPASSSAWGPRCLFVPRERSASLFRCVDLCKERGGTPACIDSAAENAFVTEAFASTGDTLWLGLYQNETALGPARGWDHCVAGDAPSFTSWEKGQPDDKAGFREDCARVDLNTGHWLDLACDGEVSGIEELELSCLCARGNASAAFADDLEALEATRHYNRRLLSARTARAFIIAIAIAMLPTLLLLARAGLHRLRHAEPSVEVQGAAPMQEPLPHALPSQSTTAGVLALERASSATSFAGVKRRLCAARKSAAGRRLRVSFAMVQAGWAFFVIAVTPTVMLQTGKPIDVDVGTFFALYPLGAYLLLLALFPTDAIAIRIVCAAVVVLASGFAMLGISMALRNHNPIAAVNVVLIFSLAGALVPTLWPRGSRAMQPRPALRRLWTAMRLFFLGSGLVWGGVCIAVHAFKVSSDKDRLTDTSFEVAMSTVYLVCAALATPRNRGRLHRRLGRLGGRGTEAEEAAAVAALVGGSNPDAALERASKLLRCLPANRLHAVDLANNTTAPPAGPTLHERTEPAAMGEVTAFLSHSWSDEKEAPGAKHAAVSRWAARHREKTGNEPTLWLVGLARSQPFLSTPHSGFPYMPPLDS
jgi:hypothetical protein